MSLLPDAYILKDGITRGYFGRRKRVESFRFVQRISFFFQAFALWDNVNKCYKVIATRLITEGDQIFVCYGGHSNGRLWIEYGFTLANNIYNKVSITYGKYLSTCYSKYILLQSLKKTLLDELDWQGRMVIFGHHWSSPQFRRKNLS